MHLIIPYAASQAFNDPQAWAGLHLPHLKALLGRLQRQQVLRDGDETPLHMPHERVLAQALAWTTDATAHDASAALPWAAWHSAQAGRASDEPQAWITPCYWQIGMNQAVMHLPQALQLSEDESRQLLLAMQPFLQEDGLTVRWHDAHTWHVSGEAFRGLSCASLDRVIGLDVRPWLTPEHLPASLRRLQSEMQMLLYNHPVNDARLAQGRLTVNSFWVHGAGACTTPTPTPSSTPPASVQADVLVLDTLRLPALRGDLAAWQAAWQALDAAHLAPLAAMGAKSPRTSGELAKPTRLTLCSKNAAHTYVSVTPSWHQRLTRLFRQPNTTAALQALLTP